MHYFGHRTPRDKETAACVSVCNIKTSQFAPALSSVPPAVCVGVDAHVLSLFSGCFRSARTMSLVDPALGSDGAVPDSESEMDHSFSQEAVEQQLNELGGIPIYLRCPSPYSVY